MGFRWDRRPDQVFPAGAENYAQRARVALRALAAYYAPQIETWLKANAPWTDRTGNARQSLYAEVLDLTNAMAIQFDHGVSYGIYLEFANTGRYAIIGPALDHWTPIIGAAVQRLLR